MFILKKILQQLTSKSKLRKISQYFVIKKKLRKELIEDKINQIHKFKLKEKWG